MATCLSVVNSVLGRLGLQTTAAAVGSTENNVANVVALANEEGQELASRYAWSALQNEATFTTLAAEDQGLIETIAPGYSYIVNDTIWNRSLRRPVFGPQSQQMWQQQKAFAINGPWSNYRVKGGHIYMYPVPSAGQDCYFEYISRNWLTDSTGVTGREEFANDADIILLDWKAITLGTIWRWKKLKGFEYAEDFNSYERRVQDLMSRDGSKDVLNFSNTKYDIFPGVVVPSGSWGV